ncbi:hypothetical protein Sliba_45240 [Streptomyces nigrescens]|uniref:Uncharacterized protein n=1 Tax=Streptomyces nigrescens TaxID=1920 RepID=A0A640TP66_STRNI|nr:hypothetical protein Sliba_45240 [Streptomyces libani subsp. libani]GGV99785.1 hypothetical protein GCM10010500_51350 [Streptomyces libani subsp. libani]
MSVSDPAFADDGNLDDEPNQNDWGALAPACLADADPWGEGRPGRLLTAGAPQRAHHQPHGSPVPQRLITLQLPFPATGAAG